MTAIPPRWYVVSSDGLATLCADEADARRGAEECDSLYPRHAPHAAVLMGDVAAERDRCAMVCEELPLRGSGYDAATMDCAAAIRAA